MFKCIIGWLKKIASVHHNNINIEESADDNYPMW